MQVNWNALPRFTAPRRFGWRVWFLPLFLWPLMLDLPIEILTGDGDGVMAAAMGLGLSWIAASRLARGQAGDNRRGAILMGVAAGLTAKLGADMGPLLAVGLGAGAYLGTRLPILIGAVLVVLAFRNDRLSIFGIILIVCGLIGVIKGLTGGGG